MKLFSMENSYGPRFRWYESKKISLFYFEIKLERMRERFGDENEKKKFSRDFGK